MRGRSIGSASSLERVARFDPHVCPSTLFTDKQSRCILTTINKLQRDPRDLPNYTLDEAARWTGVNRSTLRVWMLGRSYRASGATKRAKPLIVPAGHDPLTLSFWNLVESSVLAAIRKEHGVSLQKVRPALDYVDRKLGMPRPLIDAEFKTDGISLFVEHFGKLIDASRHGQQVLREGLEASLKRIEADQDGLAVRLFPWRGSPFEPRVVVVDPRIAFGKPVISKTRVPLEDVLERFRAGDTIEGLSRDYRVKIETIEELVRRWFGSAAA